MVIVAVVGCSGTMTPSRCVHDEIGLASRVCLMKHTVDCRMDGYHRPKDTGEVYGPEVS